MSFRTINLIPINEHNNLIGNFRNRIARVSSCAENATTCSVSIVPLTSADKRKHTTVSSNHLNLIDIETLNAIERRSIEDEIARRERYAENVLNNKVLRSPSKGSFPRTGIKGPGSGLKKRKSSENDECSDDDDDEAGDGDESRYSILILIPLMS